MRKFSSLLLIGLLIIGISVIGFSADKELLTIGTTDRATDLSPANAWDFYTMHLLGMLSDGLLKVNPKTAEVEPALAKDWEVGPNAKVYTFHLVEGATFTDGAPVNAQAVKWSLERSLRLNGPKGPVFLYKKLIDKIEVVDDLTVKITLKSPNATFLKRIAANLGCALIWSPKSTPEDEFANGQLAGVGPYKLKKFSPGQAAVYEAYEDYYGESPKIKNVVELKYTQSAQLRSATEAGKVDIAFRTLNPIDTTQLKKNPNLKVRCPSASPSIRYMLFNVTDKQFSDERVRRAISYAVDRKIIIDQVFSGLANPIYTMVPKVFSQSIDVFPKQDLEKAESLLESAGYTEENPLETVLWFSPKHYGTTEADVAATIQGTLDSLPNMQVRVKSLEWGAYEKRKSEGGFGMFLLGWYPDYLEASNFITPWTTGTPESQGTYFNHHPNYEAYKKIMDTALATPDIETRSALYKAIQILSAHDVPWIPLWANLAQSYVIYKPNLKNVFVDARLDLRPWLISRK